MKFALLKGLIVSAAFFVYGFNYSSVDKEGIETNLSIINARNSKIQWLNGHLQSSSISDTNLEAHISFSDKHLYLDNSRLKKIENHLDLVKSMYDESQKNKEGYPVYNPLTPEGADVHLTSNAHALAQEIRSDAPRYENTKNNASLIKTKIDTDIRALQKKQSRNIKEIKILKQNLVNLNKKNELFGKNYLLLKSPVDFDYSRVHTYRDETNILIENIKYKEEHPAISSFNETPKGLRDPTYEETKKYGDLKVPIK